MDIFTLLKANIRYKKGAFISIVLLMMIIAMSLTTILSVKENCTNSHVDMLNEANEGNIIAFIMTRRLTKELLQSAENHPLVDKVEHHAAIVVNQAESEKNSDSNAWFLLKLRNGFKLYTDDLTAYEKDMPSLMKGEIYITQGIATRLECKKGDTIKLSTIAGKYNFKIKGIFAEPMLGSSNIGWKQLFISDADFEQLYLNCKKAETKEQCADAQVVHFYKKDNCKLSDSQFRRKLNLDTGVIDRTVGSLTRDMSMRYTNLFPDIILSVLMVFIIFLFAIVLIVMGHSISTGIEMEYLNLGILKSQGFTRGKIRAVWFLQYFLAQLAGTITGLILTAPLIRKLGNVFQPITGIMPGKDISFLKIVLVILSILIVSGCLIFAITKKLDKISPVKAISGGHSDIYFDSRIKAPICKKGLLASLALRQLTSNKKRYIGTVVIVSILVFFMMTVTILGNIVDSKSAVEAMGVIYTECDIEFKEYPDDKLLKSIEETVEKYSPIEKRYYMNTLNCSVNGEEIHCQIQKNPEVIKAVKGRSPLYDNEINITEILGEELDLKMGDKVTVAYMDKKAEYIISGIYQSMQDVGLEFMISLEGAKKLGISSIVFGGYSLSFPEKAKEAADALNDTYGDILVAEDATEGNVMEGTYVIAINAMKGVIFSFSVLFALLVVIMTCSKIFLQEKNDIGIYKAIGFTSRQLRLQFAFRFLMVALIGSVLGTVLSVLFSDILLNNLLRGIGITNLVARFTTATIIVPAVLISGCFFLFAFFISGKVKRVEAKGLMLE